MQGCLGFTCLPQEGKPETPPCCGPRPSVSPFVTSQFGDAGVPRLGDLGLMSPSQVGAGAPLPRGIWVAFGQSGGTERPPRTSVVLPAWPPVCHQGLQGNPFLPSEGVTGGVIFGGPNPQFPASWVWSGTKRPRGWSGLSCAGAWLRRQKRPAGELRRAAATFAPAPLPLPQPFREAGTEQSAVPGTRSRQRGTWETSLPSSPPQSKAVAFASPGSV